MCMNELLVRSGSTSLVSLDPRRSLLKVAEDTLDLLERAAQVVGDLLGQHMRFWQFRRILEAFVLEPEDVEATLVTGCELLVGETRASDRRDSSSRPTEAFACGGSRGGSRRRTRDVLRNWPINRDGRDSASGRGRSHHR